MRIRLLLADGTVLLLAIITFAAGRAGWESTPEMQTAQLRAEQIWYTQPFNHYRIVIQQHTRTGTCEQDLEIRMIGCRRYIAINAHNHWSGLSHVFLAGSGNSVNLQEDAIPPPCNAPVGFPLTRRLSSIHRWDIPGTFSMNGCCDRTGKTYTTGRRFFSIVIGSIARAAHAAAALSNSLSCHLHPFPEQVANRHFTSHDL